MTQNLLVKSHCWVLLAMTVAVAACGGGGGDAGTPGAGPLPPAETSPFVGNYDVSYIGARQGSCSVQVTSAGLVGGTCINNTGDSETLSGTVTPNGNFLSTAVGTLSDGTVFSGVLANGAGSGTWRLSTASGADDPGDSWTLAAPAVAVSKAPLLSAPDAGSTAASGLGLDGVWRNSSDEPLVVTADNRLYLTSFSSASDNVRGAFNLSFAPGPNAVGSFTGTNTYGFTMATKQPLVVSGTFTPRLTLGMSCYTDLSLFNQRCDYTSAYDPSNALAVAPSDLQGRWASVNAPDFSVNAAGTLAARTAGALYGECQLAGSLTQSQPGTLKNLFEVTLTAATVAGGTCNLSTTLPYTGQAYLRVVNVGSPALPYYKHSLQIFASQETGAGVVPALMRLLSVRR